MKKGEFKHPINRGLVVEHDGKRQTIEAHAEEHGQPVPLVLERLKNGMSIARALSLGKRPRAMVHLTAEHVELAAKNRLTREVINFRLASGWPVDEAVGIPPGMHSKIQKKRKARRAAIVKGM